MVKAVWSVIKSWWRRSAVALTIVGLVALFAIGYCWPKMVYTIHPGEAGVIWRRFGGGTVIDAVYTEGTTIIPPWDRLYVYNVRLQNADDSVRILTADGLEVGLDLSVRYKPVEKTIAQLHKNVGPDYVRAVVMPEVVNAVRQVVAHFKPDELYSTKPEQIQRDLVALGSRQTRDRFVVIDDVLIRAISLPPQIQAAVQKKLEAEQLALEWDYRIEQESKEARRKSIEAEGIRRFQQIVGEGLSEKLLQWKGIEASLELAKSSNSKVVVFGRGNLPLVLGKE
jgi:regulator of protease activity HflC (stomatin/prohibitin superfamily)